MSGDPKTSAQEVARQISDVLVPSGWTVELSTLTLPRFTISVDHELTSPFMLGMDASKESLQGSVARFLNRFEFDAIRRRPEVPHAALLSALRALARMSRWDQLSLARLAETLASFDLLTSEEAAWLAYAGPSWAEPDDDVPAVIS
jgi:hypothetical protein